MSIVTLKSWSLATIDNDLLTGVCGRAQYIDPVRTYIVDTYGVALRFEEKSVDDETRVTRWINPVAPGLREAKEKPAIHAADFMCYPHKAKQREIPNEKITYRFVLLPVLACLRDRFHSLCHRTRGALRLSLLLFSQRAQMPAHGFLVFLLCMFEFCLSMAL